MTKKRFDAGFAVILALLVGAGTVSWNLFFKEYSQPDKYDIHNFPLEIGGWTARNLTITEREYEILETRNVFVREYTSPDGEEKATLMLVYSQNNRKVSHPPEVCYTGSGLSVLENDIHALFSDPKAGTVETNRLVLEQGDFQQMAYYWFKVGDEFTPNYWKQQGIFAIKSLLGQSPSSALIRISIPIDGDNRDIAQKTAQKFAHLVVPIINDLP